MSRPKNRQCPKFTRTCAIELYKTNFLSTTPPRLVTFCDSVQFQNAETDDDTPDDVDTPTVSTYPTETDIVRVWALPLEPCLSPTPEWGLSGDVP